MTRAEYLRLPRWAQQEAEEAAWPPAPAPAPPAPAYACTVAAAPFTRGGRAKPTPWWRARVTRVRDGATVGVGAGPTRAAAEADAERSVRRTNMPH